MARRTEKAETIDKHIGQCIKSRREHLGMTQAELAEAAGVSYQQIHKYERGSNRISAGRLGLIAEILQIPVQYFYSPSQEETIGKTPDSSGEGSRIAFEMARYFRRITNPRLQEAVHQLVRTISQQ
jgi:transcriptional regulator with XRE-family HTH domain